MKRKERGIWQRRFWEHTLCDEYDYTAHVDYIHFNWGNADELPSGAGEVL